jgi:two-component system, NtrC family, response regulator
MADILIIDDDRVLCEMLCDSVGRMGHSGRYALTLEDGMRYARRGAWDVVFLDVRLPDGNGLDALPRIRTVRSFPEVIIFTGEGDPDGAQTAIQQGAWDYVEKPGSLSAMMLPMMRALEYRSARCKSIVNLPNRCGILGGSPEIEKCLSLVADAARSEKEVLILGETGTGKELFARAVHGNSRRSSKDFVVVDCAALPETLAESILFGHEKGAFTSAGTARSGLVKQADGGVLFLDEIGELPLSLQKAFLRVLQEKTFRPIGGRLEVRSDFRLVAATNRDLDEMVSKGLFREDLLFRIKSWVVSLPPLRERTGDIMEITLRFSEVCQKRSGGGTKGFSPEFIEALTAYPWPGNVRELLMALETAIEKSQDESTLYHKHLPAHIRVQVARAALGKNRSSRDASKIGKAESDRLLSFKEFRARGLVAIEKEYLQELLHLSGGDIKKACEISNISRSHLYRLLQEHRLTEDK